MKTGLWIVAVTVVLSSQVFAITYDSEVLTWPKVIVQIEQVDTIIDESFPQTQGYAHIEENSEALRLSQGDTIDFILPGGTDGENTLVIPGIPQLIPGHFYIMSIPPDGIPDLYFGPMTDLAEIVDREIVFDENNGDGPLPTCPYSRWNSYKWTYQNDSVTFKCYSGLSSSFRNEFNTSRDVWNGQSSEYISYGGTTSARTGQNNLNTVDYAYMGTQGGVLASTYAWVDSSGHFTETDVVFNFSFTFNTSCASDSYDFRTVSTHELGHVFGLGHVSDSNQVMYGYTSIEECRRTLGCGDIAGVKSIYGDHIWNWTTNALGCTLHDASTSAFLNGFWKINPGLTNPYVQFPSKTINQASRYKYIHIIGASNVLVTNRKARIYYRCAGQSTWPSDQYKEFTWSSNANGDINILVSMGTIHANKPWINNQIVQIRLVLPPQYNDDERVYLDWVKILNNY